MPCQHLDYASTLDGGRCNDCGIELVECSWCGDNEPAYGMTGERRWYANRGGEQFCCASHRGQSNAALRRLH